MGRKVFQDFAHVLCQRFVEVPSHKDLVNLVILGDGTLELDITGNKARHNRFPIDPLPYISEMRSWLDRRLAELNIPTTDLVRAILVANYSLVLTRRPPMPGFAVQIDFACSGTIEAPDRSYASKLNAQKQWGLIQA